MLSDLLLIINLMSPDTTGGPTTRPIDGPINGPIVGPSVKINVERR